MHAPRVPCDLPFQLASTIRFLQTWVASSSEPRNDDMITDLGQPVPSYESCATQQMLMQMDRPFLQACEVQSHFDMPVVSFLVLTILADDQMPARCYAGKNTEG